MTQPSEAVMPEPQVPGYVRAYAWATGHETSGDENDWIWFNGLDGTWLSDVLTGLVAKRGWKVLFEQGRCIRYQYDISYQGEGSTPAEALCAAVLKAMEAAT